MIRKIVSYTLAAVVGLGLYFAVLGRGFATVLFLKAAGKIECPWGRVVVLPWHTERFFDLQSKYNNEVKQVGTDGDLLQFATPLRSFWMSNTGRLPAPKLLALLLAEQDWVTQLGMPDVRPGDVVVDVGAHVGTFSAHALAFGASKVVMVEPDPVNIECLRRNFKAELASGRAVLVPAGAWSSESTMEMHHGVENSGSGSLVIKEVGSSVLRVPVRPLDTMLRELGITKVDVIKMDIEGAEREALRGAAGTLRDSKPRLMLDAYHLADDRTVIPAVIRAANPSYREKCGPCQGDGGDIIPHSLYFE